MERFEDAWLTLREPIDHRARASALTDRLTQAWSAAGWSRVVDLGSGTGSNLRFLDGRLAEVEEWILVEQDPDHVARLRAVSPTSGRVDVQTRDLATSAVEGVWSAHLVTAAALLDLVSKSWLETLVGACADAGAAALFVLSYDGQVGWERASGAGSLEVSALDTLVLDAVNRDQQRDKGFGPALGSLAGVTAERLFRAAGYRTWLEPSPWRLAAAEAALVRRLVAGWQEVAASAEPNQASELARWADDRVRSLAAGHVTVEVGHVDLLALPPGSQ
jgi:hypothetical protein